MLKPEGIIPAMITPFTEREELNEPGLRDLVRRFIQARVQGIFCLGTNGEFFNLTLDEKLKVAEITMDEAKGAVPVYVGAGGIGTEEVIRLARQMEQIGVNALSLITPYFLTFSQKELIEHYTRIANSTSLPILLYNIPARTGNSLHPETVAVLSKIPNIVGIKDSSGNFDTILQYLDLTDPDFSVLSGTDSLILSTLMAGGKGGIASTANVFPEIVISIYEHWRKGEFEAAEEAQKHLRAIRNVLQLGTLPSVLKEMMNQLGLPAGSARMPVGNLTEEARKVVHQVLRNYKESGLIL